MVGKQNGQPFISTKSQDIIFTHSVYASLYFDEAMQTRNVERHICPSDLDLWHSDPKINRGHLLVMTNLHVKYEDSVINGI